MRLQAHCVLARHYGIGGVLKPRKKGIPNGPDLLGKRPKVFIEWCAKSLQDDARASLMNMNEAKVPSPSHNPMIYQ